MSGLLNYLQDEEERVQRKAQRQIGQYNRQVGLLKADIAPHQQKIEQFNKDVEGYNNGWYNGGQRYMLQNGVYSRAPDGSQPMHGAPAGYIAIADGGSVGKLPTYVFNKHQKPDEAGAKASNDFITSQEGRIGAIKSRGEHVERKTGRDADRLANEVELNRRKIMEQEMAKRAPNPNSAFDEKSAGVFESIANWLRG